MPSGLTAASAPKDQLVNVGDSRETEEWVPVLECRKHICF